MPGEPGAKKVEPEIGDAQDVRVNVNLYQRYTGAFVDLLQILNLRALQLHIRAVVLALVFAKVDADTHVLSLATPALVLLVKSRLV